MTDQDVHVEVPVLTVSEARALCRAADLLRVLVQPDGEGCACLQSAALKLTVGMERAGVDNELLGWVV